ncbi:ATP-binding cassette domain-containing protein [Bovifimicola ammoniilytica]|jgi:ABC-2 type transport system ATP-binding protein|uniref:ATP-binding cassette domain-containing protein n=1 Tax=Bovifimicola ammoniilytica TaxID=2981720 RepID=UPI00082062C8|nr:ATP-binding cassette domain-containing protein [Bovifimicola ammoniilytica]MCU6752098.1 ATP-binding cassette domain-containing protein [Bovifimicola ammoniilytica]SCJ08161.1 Fe(3+) ions import ATP-binding protein FbpC [uncultured Eubacterium sp.]
MIKIENYSKKIKDTVVLENINMVLNDGMIYGIQGENGSGKTMLMRGICGLIKGSEGCITIDGKVIGKDISFPEDIGVLIENPSFIPKYTGYKNLKLVADIQGKVDKEEIKKTLQKVGLKPDDKRTYKKYSLGMKQRLGIACAIMGTPKLIILDEPFNGLDEKGVLQIRDVIKGLKQKNCIVIVACHDKEQLEYLSDEIYVIKEGKLQ